MSMERGIEEPAGRAYAAKVLLTKGSRIILLHRNKAKLFSLPSGEEQGPGRQPGNRVPFPIYALIRHGGVAETSPPSDERPSPHHAQ